MDQAGSQLPWNEEQWTKVQNAVTEAFTRASVAGAFLPCFEPENPSAEAVRAERLSARSKSDPRVSVSDIRTLPLFGLSVHVALSNQQVSDPGLSVAQFSFKRAASLLAQAEDFIVFSGYKANTGGVGFPFGNGRNVPIEVKVSGGLEDTWGLIEYGELTVEHVDEDAKIAMAAAKTAGKPEAEIDEAGENKIKERPLAKDTQHPRGAEIPRGRTTSANGAAIVEKVSGAIGRLESLGHPGPYACLLDTKLFQAVQASTESSLVLPSDRIKAMLGGPLLRSGQIPERHGVVVSLASEVVDLVVATPPKAQFLQITEDAKFLFRVYERFILRIKEFDRSTAPVKGAAYTFHLAA